MLLPLFWQQCFLLYLTPPLRVTPHGWDVYEVHLLTRNTTFEQCLVFTWCLAAFRAYSSKVESMINEQMPTSFFFFWWDVRYFLLREPCLTINLLGIKHGQWQREKRIRTRFRNAHEYRFQSSTRKHLLFCWKERNYWPHPVGARRRHLISTFCCLQVSIHEKLILRLIRLRKGISNNCRERDVSFGIIQ